MAQIGNIIFSISADLRNLQGQLRTMEGQFQSSFGKIESVVGKANSVLGTFGIGLGLGAVVAFGKSIVDSVGHLQDLSNQTKISASTLSGLQSTLEENGTSVDAFAKGVFNAQRVLGGVDEESDKAAKAVKDLHLNLDELRNVSTDRFLELVAGALSKVPHQMDRARIGADLMGKSFKELAPALAEISVRFQQLKTSGLTDEDIKLLDEAGDAWTRLGNKVKIGAADLFASAIRDLQAVKELITLNLGLLRKEGGLGGAIGGVGDLLSAEGMVKPLPPAPPFKGSDVKTTGKSSAEKAAEQTRTFLESLERQLTDIEVRSTELQFGPEAGLTAKLEAQFDAFKQKLTDEKLPIPKGLDAFFDDLKTKIVGATQKLEQLRFEMERLDAVGKAMSQDSAEWLNVDADLAAAKEKAKALRQDFDKLKTGLKIEAIDTSTPDGKRQQQWARMQAEAQETAQKIEELGRASGASQSEIAAAVQDAWSKAFNEIGAKAEESTIFQQRAWERMHDAIGDLTTDLLTGQIKSWEDFGSRVLTVIQSITAEFAALQLKAALFGENFGSKGAGGQQIGGLLGSLGNSLGGSLGKWLGSSAATQYSTTIGGSFNVEELMWGIMASVGHSGGIVGDHAMPRRSVPAAVFIDAPRYHSGGWAGLKPDEMPIIAQKGERIMPRWESAQAPSYAMAGRNQGDSGTNFAVDVKVLGDITPKQPGMTKDDVIQIGIKQLDTRGSWMQVMEQRTSIKGA